MPAIVALNNANITAAMINAPDGTLPPALPGRATDNSKKSTDKRVKNTAVIHFLSNLLRKKLYIHPADENNHDPVDDISDSLAGLTLNSVINTAKTIRKILQNELKLIFPAIFPPNANSDSNKANTSKQIPSIQKKIEPQSEDLLISKDLPC
ncbi:30832_t:CDS:2 [Racocetra persica]|uniref:30832_t:CDS:1 n=1 Tax=Racocetra persica TaxID=160502 RepID=A0ACA9KB83_9GLOM|nr:30832_t:CDS:2 [Racocetra persica]